MSEPFTTQCPHCGQPVEVSYRDAMRELGRRSVMKRKPNKHHMSLLGRKSWKNRPPTPVQQALIALSQKEDLEKLTLTEIAQRIGITGSNLRTRVLRNIRRLQKKGLLPANLRTSRLLASNLVTAIPTHPTQQKILDLSKSENIEQFTLKEIADKVDVTGPYRVQNISYHLYQLEAKGLLPLKEN